MPLARGRVGAFRVGTNRSGTPGRIRTAEYRVARPRIPKNRHGSSRGLSGHRLACQGRRIERFTLKGNSRPSGS